ncbi:MAG: hypothetical protein JEZ12_23535 [Desulfobacterium sp.]|nr:hypothetical protein [Desulfobacterium sp.]
MNINELIETITNAVADQEELNAWSTIEYDRGYRVFENIDMRNPPEEEDCPLVVVRPSEKSGGMSRSVKSFTLAVDCLVFDDGIPEEINGVIRFKGGRLVEEFRTMVFSHILAAIPSDCHIADIEVQYDTVEQFPYIWCGMGITIEQGQIIGVNPYE